jgi:hypothetical protein
MLCPMSDLKFGIWGFWKYTAVLAQKEEKKIQIFI